MLQKKMIYSAQFMYEIYLWIYRYTSIHILVFGHIWNHKEEKNAPRKTNQKFEPVLSRRNKQPYLDTKNIKKTTVMGNRVPPPMWGSHQRYILSGWPRSYRKSVLLLFFKIRHRKYLPEDKLRQRICQGNSRN